jgi:hypothetical protein
MPVYRRYGYIVTVEDWHASIGLRVGPTIVGFHPNPAKANEDIDLRITQVDSPESVEDTPFEPDSSLNGQKVRVVFIKYSDQSWTRFKLERWWFEVGRQ